MKLIVAELNPEFIDDFGPFQAVQSGTFPMSAVDSDADLADQQTAELCALSAMAFMHVSGEAYLSRETRLACHAALAKLALPQFRTWSALDAEVHHEKLPYGQAVRMEDL
jgi:hypothetical protein